MISENQHLTRQRDIIPLNVLTKPITIIGAGAVGSFTALSLAKMGFSNITVYDDDIIDIENMNCQFFRFKDIGASKVDALRDLIFNFTNIKIKTIKDRWKGEMINGILISAVDNMSTRKAIFEAHSNKVSRCELIIDPRMSAEVAMMMSYRPMKKSEFESYEKSLYSDDEAVQERCTAKSTIYCVLNLSSMICSALKTYLVNGEITPQVLVDVPKYDLVAFK